MTNRDPGDEHQEPLRDFQAELKIQEEYVRRKREEKQERIRREILEMTFSHRHPNSARFHELLAEAGELHDVKQQDYGRGDDPFANVRSSEEWGIQGWVGSMVRLNDKVKRLQTLARKGELRNEAAIDSFMDIAVYALIARVLYEQEQMLD